MPIQAMTRAAASASPRWRLCSLWYGSQRRGSISAFLVVPFGAAVAKSQAMDGRSGVGDPKTFPDLMPLKGAAIRDDRKASSKVRPWMAVLVFVARKSLRVRDVRRCHDQG